MWAFNGAQLVAELRPKPNSGPVPRHVEINSWEPSLQLGSWTMSYSGEKPQALLKS